MVAKKTRQFLFLMTVLTFAGCNQDQNQSQNQSPSTDSKSGSNNLAISNVVLSAASENQTSAFSLYFQPVQSDAKLSDFCQSTSGASCFCQFTWTVNDPYDSGMQGAVETVNSPLNVLDSNFATCSMDEYSVISDFTDIQISVVSYPSNSAPSSTVGSFNYTKVSSIQDGNYYDFSGRPYVNIIQYNCARVDLAPSTDNTIDMFIPESFLGDVMSASPLFQCTYPGSNVAIAKKFSLSSTSYWLFPIQVRAAVIITGADSIEGATQYASLGYAAAPNSDGTCPSFKMNSGTMTKTYILRKFDPVEQWKTPIYELDQDGTNLSPPTGYNEDKTFQACAPASV